MTTVVVAVVVAVVSGLGATLLTISHERGAELRGRMLDAADDFSTRVVSALHVARNTSGDILRLGADTVLVETDTNWKPEVRELVDRVGHAVDEAQARQARVHLLFRDESDAGVAATEIITRLRNVELAIHDWPHSIRDSGAMRQYSRNYDAVVTALTEFNRAALLQLRDTWPRRLARRTRQGRRGRKGQQQP